MKRKNVKVSSAVYPNVFELSVKDKKWIESTLSQMSLHEKCAQMVMPWILADFMNEDSPEYQRAIKLVRDNKVGGFIFFKGDIINEALIINKLQKFSKIPLLISSDFERGLAMRLRDGIEFPYNMALAATGNFRLAYNMGKAIALECRTIGVHQNYAPVADLNDNPKNPIINIRAYSQNQEIAAQYCSEFIKGTNSERILSTAKHFPGHGNTKIDSHKDLPVIKSDKNKLFKNELVPFIQSIKDGVQSIMIGHLAVPALDSSNVPATLSKPIITDLLINQLGFTGLIVTDAMNMSAITNYYSIRDASIKAVEAGIDILLFPPDEELAINAITNAVKSGRLSEDRINVSVRKILSAKKWLGIDKKGYSDLKKITKIVGQKSHLELSKEIAEKSITLVKDLNKIIPINLHNIKQIACVSISDGDESVNDILFHKLVKDIPITVKNISLNKKSMERDYKRAYHIAEQSNIILIPSFVRVKAYKGTVELSIEKVEFIKNILKLNIPTIVMSFGTPYLLSGLQDIKTYLCAYGDSSISQKAMIRAIFGEINISGKLPVSITKTKFKIGSGIMVNQIK